MTDFIRTRRLRQSAALRAFSCENNLCVSDLIYPLFVIEGEGIRNEISSMPGQYQLSLDNLGDEIEELQRLGIPAVLLFGIPAEKDEQATGAYASDGIVQQAIRRIKAVAPDVLVITDVCCCEYTSHGHCGIIVGNQVDNDLTLPILARTAVSHAEAGADIVAPSDMMDGRVAALRAALDSAGYHTTPILSYAAKYASGYYGPFREAAESTPTFGDRRTHQMDPANSREAMREIDIDLAEGADAIIVKPALAYMDILRAAKDRTLVPVVAYNVSGEFAMIKAAAERGWIDEERVVMETMLGFKRAGADRIITYHAKDIAGWLAEN
ncbi:MAG: porphobilinogen synthase [Thermomicrobiales bacterium]|nr:porphobilinogen synthase [Thermomicrobiales bacterium]MCO5225540.1 porphobilinogen synthase [Thermomicrobiales bacterium]MCO5228176.1 porphobilinogen synthase [Thermomicrobiales bacterium]